MFYEIEKDYLINLDNIFAINADDENLYFVLINGHEFTVKTKNSAKSKLIKILNENGLDNFTIQI